MRVGLIEKALDREAVLFEEKCRNGYVLDTSTKFADFANEWLTLNKGNHAPGSLKLAEDLLVRINAGIGHIPLGKLRSHHIQAFYNNLAEEGVKSIDPVATSDKLAVLLKERKLTRAAVGKSAGVSSKKEKLADETLKRYYGLVSSILGAAVQMQAIPDNPASRVIKPKGTKKEAAYLDDKDALQVMEVLEKAPLKWRTAMMLLLYSGMRRQQDGQVKHTLRNSELSEALRRTKPLVGDYKGLWIVRLN